MNHTLNPTHIKHRMCVVALLTFPWLMACSMLFVMVFAPVVVSAKATDSKGIGGSMTMVPVMTVLLANLGFAPQVLVQSAIATSLASVCFTSLSSVRAHHKRGAVRWPIVLAFTPGILLGAYLGGYIAALLSSAVLGTLFAGFMLFSAYQMLRKTKPSNKAARELPGTAGMLATGGGIGTLSGILGAGGGFLSVPFMTWCSVPIHNAVATSAALGFPIALAGTVSYIVNGWGKAGLVEGSLGFVFLPATLVIVLTSVFTAPLGAKAAHRMNTAALKRAFGCMVLMLGSYMLWHTVFR